MLPSIFDYATAQDAIKDYPDIKAQLNEELEKRLDKLLHKGWIARKPKGFYWPFLMWLKYNIRFADLDCLSITTGSEGCGKTNFDVFTGAVYDETFDPDSLPRRLIASYIDLDNFYDEEPQYCYGFVDEGSIFGARETLSPENKALINTLMISREGTNRFIQCNIPYFGEIDTFLRNQRLRFVVKCNMRLDKKIMLMKKGPFEFYTKKTSQLIGKDYRGKLRFPKPDEYGYCPRVCGDLWRAYKEISTGKKREIRKQQREKIEKHNAKKESMREMREDKTE